MRIIRRKTKIIKIGNIHIGGNNPVTIQSMTKTKTADIENTIQQIRELENTGCEIVRLAVKDNVDARAIKKIKPRINIPIVADIHFNWQLALEAIDNGADKIRLNPGNIYKKEQIREIVRAAKLNRIAVRVGVNSGSVKRNTQYLTCSGRQGAIRNTTVDIMVKSALDYIKILEGFKFYDIVVSLKASNIFDTIEAYRKIARICDYPLHLGVTATGASYMGRIKSSIAIGALLLEGIGDTIRVSLTDKPPEEVKVAKSILESVGLRRFGPEIISCPTCGRCEVDLVKLVKEFENKLDAIRNTQYAIHRESLKIAIMGCIVNGPGEASEADIGVAFGKKEGLLFRKHKAIRKISFANCIATLLKEIRRADV